jgi:hypothetical protein
MSEKTSYSSSEFVMTEVLGLSRYNGRYVVVGSSSLSGSSESSAKRGRNFLVGGAVAGGVSRMTSSSDSLSQRGRKRIRVRAKIVSKEVEEGYRTYLPLEVVGSGQFAVDSSEDDTS